MPDDQIIDSDGTDDWATNDSRSREEVSADTHFAIRESGRRKAGTTGAVFAGVMLALQEIYEGPLPEQITIVADADGDPHDLDTDGLNFSVADNLIISPPITRVPPIISVPPNTRADPE